MTGASNMNTYIVTEVGEPMGKPQKVLAHSGGGAVARVADCSPFSVGLPIWKDNFKHCYMPLDGTVRQWLVTGPIAED